MFVSVVSFYHIKDDSLLQVWIFSVFVKCLTRLSFKQQAISGYIVSDQMIHALMEIMNFIICDSNHLHVFKINISFCCMRTNL